ncbi:MAG: hypothetical protein CMJ18_15290 [Phycisphaeraceae bacterium]|nr:hypothetical protein [Phycisphaeraceae bacterium]
MLFAGAASSSDLTVDLNGNREVIEATFDRAESYLLDTTVGTNTLSLGNGDITVLDGSHTINSNVELLAQGDWNINGGDSLTVAGAISGVFALDKENTGTLKLTGANTYSGVTRVRDGTMILSGADERIADASSVRVHSGATLELDGITETVGGLRNSPGGIVLNSSAILKIGADNTLHDFPGVISGTGSLVKIGTARQSLTGVNMYTGGTTIEDGILLINSDSGLGDTNGGLTMDGGTLRYDATFDLDASRTITLEASGGTFDTNGFDTTLAQSITGDGVLTMTGNGVLTLGANNTHGGTRIEGGVVAIAGANRIGAGGTNLTLASGGTWRALAQITAAI